MSQSITYGIHAVQALLEKTPEHVSSLFIAKGREDKRLKTILALAQEAGTSIEYVSRDKLDQLTNENHQGVIANTKKVAALSEAELPKFLEQLDHPPFVIILDGVQDPHNLGACIRTADAAGADCLIIPKDKAVGITPVVRKVACGAAEVLPIIQVTNLARTMRVLKDAGIWLYGAAGEAEQSIYDLSLTGAIALVLGAEGSGLRQLTRKECDGLMHIPMAGSVSSLNVSVATGVCCFEAVRQRQA